MDVALLLLALMVPQAPPDTAVVCPAEFQGALRPWINFRTQQGHEIVMLSNAGTQLDIARAIRELAAKGTLRNVVLVGDADPRLFSEVMVRRRCVPTHYHKAEINVQWGSEPYLATDQPYGDLDEDGVPELAVGRLSAATPAELARIVDKIIAYERSTDFGPWRRQLNLVAGMGGFGPLADMAIESATRHFVSREVPDEYALSMTYASWRSPYCPDPRLFRATTLERLNEGALFWVYIGHGYPLGLDMVHVPGAYYPILSVNDAPLFRCRRPAPIALFLACYTGAYDASADCLAEQMLRAPGGPVAVLAGSRVTMPYAMAVMSSELMNAVFHNHSPTLGAAILEAKRNMVRAPAREDWQRTTLDALALVISPSPTKLSIERAEHVLLFNLLGDPLLRLRHPQPAKLHLPASIAAGEALEIEGSSIVDGHYTVELVVPRGAFVGEISSRSDYPRTNEELAALQGTYARANDVRLAAAAGETAQGRFSTRLRVPDSAKGKCHVRVYVESREDFAMAAQAVQIVTNPAKVE